MSFNPQEISIGDHFRQYPIFHIIYRLSNLVSFLESDTHRKHGPIELLPRIKIEKQLLSLENLMTRLNESGQCNALCLLPRNKDQGFLDYLNKTNSNLSLYCITLENVSFERGDISSFPIRNIEDEKELKFSSVLTNPLETENPLETIRLNPYPQFDIVFGDLTLLANAIKQVKSSTASSTLDNAEEILFHDILFNLTKSGGYAFLRGLRPLQDKPPEAKSNFYKTSLASYYYLTGFRDFNDFTGQRKLYPAAKNPCPQTFDEIINSM